MGPSNIQTMSAMAAGKNSRPHITLNPYSTQLVDNINMMMPNNNGSTSSSSNSHDSSCNNRNGKSMTTNNSSASNSSSSTASTTLGRQLLNPQSNNNMSFNPQLATLTNTLRGRSGNDNIQVDQDFSQATNGEVVYRAVSPHGHVYWEIDPGQVYAATLAANNSASKPHQQPQQQSPYSAYTNPTYGGGYNNFGAYPGNPGATSTPAQTQPGTSARTPFRLHDGSSPSPASKPLMTSSGTTPGSRASSTLPRRLSESQNDAVSSPMSPTVAASRPSYSRQTAR